MIEPKTTLHIWRHIAMRLPADWEMLQFSSEFARGRCAFADRYQFRCEISWRNVPGEPDYDRMVSDYLNKLKSEKKIENGTREQKSGWHGIRGIINGENTSRFGRYIPEIGCLLEMVLLWPDPCDHELEACALASIEARPPREHQEWQAFGMHITLPTSIAFENCTSLPARAEFSFNDIKNGNAWSLSRRGMLPSWFDGNLQEWLRRDLGKRVRDLRFTHRHHHGRDLLMAEGRYKPPFMHLRLGDVTAAAWIERSDGRLYCAKKWQYRPIARGNLPVEDTLKPA